MKHFLLIFESTVADILKEGGAAVPNVDRIKKEAIDTTIKKFKDEILVEFFGHEPTDDEMFLLGSTGKKAESGDIDIGIDATKLGERDIIKNLIKLNELCTAHERLSVINSFTYNMLHVAYPQYGRSSHGKKVQIDLILSENPNFIKFWMFFPGEQFTRYKSAHRNTLLHSILTVASYRPLQYDDQGECIKWEQLEVNWNGIYKQLKTLVDENGNRLTYRGTSEKLWEAYAKTAREVPFILDVDDAISFMVGDGFEVGDIDTFEKLFDIISTNDKFKYAEQRDEILKKAVEEFKIHESKLEFPSELQPFK